MYCTDRQTYTYTQTFHKGLLIASERPSRQISPRMCTLPMYETLKDRSVKRFSACLLSSYLAIYSRESTCHVTDFQIPWIGHKDLKLSATPTAKTKSSPNQFVLLFVFTSSGCGLPSPPAHGCYVWCFVMFCIPFFLALFRRLLEALSSFSCSLPHSASCLWASTAQTSPPTSCRLVDGQPLSSAPALKHQLPKHAETFMVFQCLSYFLHVLKHSGFFNLSGKICRRLLGATLDALQWVSPCLQCSSVSYWAGTESLENLIRLVNQSSGECCPCHFAGTILFLLCQGIRFTWNLWWHLWGMQRRRKVQKSPEKSDFLLDTWATSFGQVMDHSHRIGRPRQNW